MCAPGLQTYAYKIPNNHWQWSIDQNSLLAVTNILNYWHANVQSFTCIGTTCKPCCNEDSDFLGLGWSLRSCVSHKLPSNAHSAGQRTTLWVPFSAVGSLWTGTPREKQHRGRQPVKRTNLIHFAVSPETILFSGVLLPFFIWFVQRDKIIISSSHLVGLTFQNLTVDLT